MWGGGGLTDGGVVATGNYTATKQGIYLAIRSSWNSGKWNANTIATSGTKLMSGAGNSAATYNNYYSNCMFLICKLNVGDTISLGASSYEAYLVYKIG